MPIYEYECTQCGHQLEELQGVNDAALTVCPACHASTLTRLISKSGFRLKGTGWYETDFKDSGKSAKPSKSADSKSSKATTATDSSSTKNTASETSSNNADD